MNLTHNNRQPVGRIWGIDRYQNKWPWPLFRSRNY